MNRTVESLYTRRPFIMSPIERCFGCILSVLCPVGRDFPCTRYHSGAHVAEAITSEVKLRIAYYYRGSADRQTASPSGNERMREAALI